MSDEVLSALELSPPMLTPFGTSSTVDLGRTTDVRSVDQSLRKELSTGPTTSNTNGVRQFGF